MEKVRQKPESRCGYKAQIKFKRVPNLSCYKIYVWDTHHNHDIDPPEQAHLLNHEVNPFQAALAERHAEVGILIRQSYQLFSRVVGGDENVGFRPIDLKNHLSSKRQLRLQHGEGTSLLEFFRDESIKKPNYYYSVQVDSDEEIASIFWADGIMRSDYAAFGNVLCFDTTFRTNHLYRPLDCYSCLHRFSIRSLRPLKSKRPLDSLAIGMKGASNKKRGRKRFKALTEKRRYKKIASPKKKFDITNA
ncbi:hypothetical protein LIER_22476 [Lithospermum erythrorhizon]|uniref:Protein FAR1-RELATED SEQUENCE n=1 Tax=Lithospermum erythrorhizon TaxID=34254 RepID=A0AAV3QVM1_LITER